MGYAFSKRDKNHVEIADALKRAGYTVKDLYMVGGGCPDMLVGRSGATWLLEVKVPDAKTKRPDNGAVRHWRLLEDTQIEWMATWDGCRVHVVTTPLEALEAVGAESSSRDLVRSQDPASHTAGGDSAPSGVGR